MNIAATISQHCLRNILIPSGDQYGEAFHEGSTLDHFSIDKHRIAILIPMSGSAGIWGPSCIANAQLAAYEFNLQSGISGREVELVLIDASAENIKELEDSLVSTIYQQGISAIVGMHVSSVRERLLSILPSHIPYIYTPFFEGNISDNRVYTIGETAEDVMAPTISQLTERFKVKRWALIGNDYIWPKISHQVAKNYIQQQGSQTVFEQYVPFGLKEPYEMLERMVLAKPDIILISLVGQDAVEFNRAFGDLNLDRHCIRLSCVAEENTLLASGVANNNRLFSISSYFQSLNTDANLSFKERYLNLHTFSAPELNTLGQSIYEGMYFYQKMQQLQQLLNPLQPKPFYYSRVKSGYYLNNNQKDLPLYLSRADGNQLIIEKQFK